MHTIEKILWFPIVLLLFIICMAAGGVIVLVQKIGKAIRRNDKLVYYEFTRLDGDLDDEPLGDIETITDLNHNLRHGK